MGSLWLTSGPVRGVRCEIRHGVMVCYRKGGDKNSRGVGNSRYARLMALGFPLRHWGAT